MTQSRWWLGLTLATVLTGALSGASRAADAVVKFQYAPAAKTRILTGKTTQTLEVQGVAPKTRINTYREQYVTTSTDQGYRVLDTLVDGTSVGQSNLDPVLAALKGKPLTLTTDREGRLLSLEGLESVAAELTKMIPPTAPESIRKVVSAEFLYGALKREWISTVTDYVGHPAVVGEAWVAVDEVSLPDGTIAKCYVAKKVTETSPLDARVQTRTNSDPTQLRAFLGADADRLLAGLKTLPGAKISGEASFLLDPQTLDAKEMKSTRRTEFVMKVPGTGDFPLTLTEVKESKEAPSK